MSYHGYSPYVSVAKRQAKALREMKKLRKKGKDIRPIEIEKRTITRTFWGKAWCNHIESLSDYENRLPRGRRYVRNGSVCHLAIRKGCVDAIVSGSELYNVRVDIGTLSGKQWNTIKENCAGKIGSVLELLNGELSDGVMQVVCDPHHGLFPQCQDIKLSCDCFDSATMCKHVAAVLYGVGARLDHSPEKLFELRGVDHNVLIDVSTLVIDTKQGNESRRRIDHANIADVFGIDLSNTTSPSNPNKSKSISKQSKAVAKDIKSAGKKSIEPHEQLPKYISGTSLRKKRGS